MSETKPISILLGTFLCLSIATSVGAADETAELMRLEQVWNEAHLKGDAAALEQLWSDDLEVVVPKMPVMKKADVLAFARSGRMKFESYATSNVQVRMYGDMALVTGRLKRSRTLNGQAIDDNWQFTKVYRRSNGQWRVIYFQASDVPIEKGV